MCGNRVEELEEQVQELQASVEGLTDELVECKVRIRELENTVDEQSGFSRSSPEQAGEKGGQTTADAADAEEVEDTSTESEILVPEAGTSNSEAPEETDNTADPEADAESETEDDSSSDIIVA